MNDRPRADLPIGDVAVRLNRTPHTLRRWERDGLLPPHLLPRRDKRGMRIWDSEQVEQIREWMIIMDLRPGKVFLAQDKGWSANGRGNKT